MSQTQTHSLQDHPGSTVFNKASPSVEVDSHPKWSGRTATPEHTRVTDWLQQQSDPVDPPAAFRINCSQHIPQQTSHVLSSCQLGSANINSLLKVVDECLRALRAAAKGVKGMLSHGKADSPRVHCA